MKTNIKPATQAQKIFGKDFDNAQILNERPEGMPFDVYKRRLRQQTRVIKHVTR